MAFWAFLQNVTLADKGRGARTNGFKGVRYYDSYYEPKLITHKGKLLDIANILE